VRIGTDPDKLSEFFMREPSMNMDEAVPLFTGDMEILSPGGWGEDDTSFYVVSTEPFPVNILCLIAEWEVGDIV
jgi:hypothetical protein